MTTATRHGAPPWSTRLMIGALVLGSACSASYFGGRALHLSGPLAVFGYLVPAAAHLVMALAVWDHSRRPRHTATTNTLRRYLYAIAAITALAAAAGTRTGAGPLPVIGGFLLNAAITAAGPLALATQLERAASFGARLQP